MINEKEDKKMRSKIELTLVSEHFEFHLNLVSQILRFFEKLGELNWEGKSLLRKPLYTFKGKIDQGPSLIHLNITFLDSMVKRINFKTEKLVHNILNFLQASINGPDQENQIDLWNGGIDDTVRELMSQIIVEKDFLLKKFAGDRNALISLSSRMIILMKL